MDEYVPPTTTWRLLDFVKATPEEIQAKTVDCPSCPVNMLCEVGQGGSGYLCEECRTTAVFVQELKPTQKHPDDVILVDCGEHKFEKKERIEQLTRCALCSGGLMEVELKAATNSEQKFSRHHYLRTVHSRVSTQTRLKTLNEAGDYWAKHYTKK